MKKFLLLAFAAFLLAACSDNDDFGPDRPVEPPVNPPVTPPADTYEILSFESSEGWLDIKGQPVVPGEVTVVGGSVAGTYQDVFWAKSPEYPTDYVEYMGNVYDGVLATSAGGGVKIGSYYLDGTGWGAQADTWGGFVLSKNYNKSAATMDLQNQFCAWTDKGANGTETFLVAYDMYWSGGTYAAPTIAFTMPRTVAYLFLANSTALYPYESSMDDFSFMVRISGYDADGKLLGEVDCPLVADGKRAEDWVKVSTETLGAVSLLKFRVVSNDSSAPAYFCMDELTLKETVSVSFESSEGLKDIEGQPVLPGEITMAGAAVSQTYQNVFWAKSISNYESYLDAGTYNGYLCSTVDENIWFGTYFSNSSYGDYWGGFVLTANFGKTATEMDYADQFTVWAERGAKTSTACLIGYDDAYSGDYARPTIEVAGQPLTFRHCYLANTVLTYTYAPQYVDALTYYYKVIVTGSLKGTKTGQVECLLVNGTNRVADWQFVDLSPLGTVDCLTFSTDTNDRNSYGPVAPAYFAVDEIGFVPVTQ